jgi:hypothetical protein
MHGALLPLLKFSLVIFMAGNLLDEANRAYTMTIQHVG